jgi:hypothetical protein
LLAASSKHRAAANNAPRGNRVAGQPCAIADNWDGVGAICETVTVRSIIFRNIVFGSLVAGSSAACVNAQWASPEVATRRVMPIPVCTTQLTPPARKSKVKAPIVRSLDAEKWMTVLVPNLARKDGDPKKGINPTDLDCTGHYLFANETLRHGLSKGGWPRMVDPDDVDMRSGPKGLRVLRLRAVTFANGDIGGPVALVRAIDDRAEVYGIGSYRGPVDAKLTPVRMGNEVMVTAVAKRCADPTNCRRVANFFLLRRGRLLNAAMVDIERVQRMPSVTEIGLYAEYRMSTDVSYKKDGIELLEKISVRIIPYEKQGDRDSNRVLRTVEFRRLLQVERDSLFASNESVWERVVGRD